VGHRQRLPATPPLTGPPGPDLHGAAVVAVPAGPDVRARKGKADGVGAHREMGQPDFGYGALVGRHGLDPRRQQRQHAENPHGSPQRVTSPKLSALAPS
jgi:hypothetical protein